jgi:hypothetical protein
LPPAVTGETLLTALVLPLALPLLLPLVLPLPLPLTLPLVLDGEDDDGGGDDARLLAGIAEAAAALQAMAAAIAAAPAFAFEFGAAVGFAFAAEGTLTLPAALVTGAVVATTETVALDLAASSALADRTTGGDKPDSGDNDDEAAAADAISLSRVRMAAVIDGASAHTKMHPSAPTESRRRPSLETTRPDTDWNESDEGGFRRITKCTAIRTNGLRDGQAT